MDPTSGLIQTEYPEVLLDASIRKTIESKDPTAITTMIAAMVKATVSPVEIEMPNGRLVRMNKK